MNDGQTFIATTGSGIARATGTPSGEWSVVRLLEAADVRCLTADPLNPGTVYAGADEQGVLRSDDGGANWHQTGLADRRIWALAASPVQPGVVYAGTKPPGLYVSRDGGESWQEMASLRRMRRWWWFTPAEPGPEYVQAIVRARQAGLGSDPGY
jgi:photosystem II stability/assembly factor-like uncharacterized protein